MEIEMDHVTDLNLADLLDGALSEPDRIRVEKHILECAKCATFFVLLNESRETRKQIPLQQEPDDFDGVSADSATLPALASPDRSVRVRFRRPCPDGPLRAHLLADQETLSRRPKLVFPAQPAGFVFQTDGTVDLVGLREEEISAAVLEFPLELLPMDQIEDLGTES